MWGLAAFLRWGIEVLPSRKVPRQLMSCIRSYFFIDSDSVPERSMALALLTTMSMPPKRSTVWATALATLASSRTSPTMGSAVPPAASISAAAVWMVPSSLGWGSVVLGMMATLAPSRAARRAMHRPMPRLPPDMMMVLPASGAAVAVMVSPCLDRWIRSAVGRDGERPDLRQRGGRVDEPGEDAEHQRPSGGGGEGDAARHRGARPLVAHLSLARPRVHQQPHAQVVEDRDGTGGDAPERERDLPVLDGGAEDEELAEEARGRREAAQREEEEAHRRGHVRAAEREPANGVVAVEVLSPPRHHGDEGAGTDVHGRGGGEV